MARNKKTIGSALACLLCACIVQGPASAETEIAKQAIAKAEAAIAKLKAECEKDLATYCPKVTPGEGRLALCIMAHDDKISDACFGAIFDVADGVSLALSNVSRAADACEDELDKYCADVEEGGGRLAQCLIDKKSELSANCRAEIAGLEARFAK